MNLKDLTVVITGCAHGIGVGFAKRFQKEGAKLVLVDINGQKLDDVFNEVCGADRERHMSYVLDLADEAERLKFFQTLEQAGKEVDVLVNNAGIGYLGEFEKTSWETLTNIINVNVFGATHLCYLFLPGMKRRGRGAIVNLSSTGAFLGANLSGVYTGTKAYIANFSEGLGMELHGSGVQVLSAHPGATDTNFWAASGWINTEYYKRHPKMSAQSTADEFVDAMLAGRARHVAGFRNRVMVLAASFVPRDLLRYLAVRKYK